MMRKPVLEPWRKVIAPHDDVLSGTFQAASFAADLTTVVRGGAVREYQDPAHFFERTVITEGMRLLLQSVAKRLTARGGDPVVQLQTAFGGGKTHTLLAVLHVARADRPASELAGVPEVLARAGVSDLPRGRVAVLDGNELSPSVPREHGQGAANTMWGELAWQLGGADGYALVAAADADGTSPGKETLATLFKDFGPAIVLVDEAVAYLRQFEAGKSYRGGTFDSNLSFVQALTEAAARVKNAMVLATLPESEMEVGDRRGRDALDSLEKYFGRIEAVWKPVATDEAFEIVRRRLFRPVGNEPARDAVCRAFAELYRNEPGAFPPETRESAYEVRLRASYPIHPEVFERLYGEWSTLPKFQRTRGVLRLMAHIIHALWRADNRDHLILPGSIPLDDSDVRTELVNYLEGLWEPIVERDVDGHRAEPRKLDDANPNLGSQQASRRAARTIFLGSAPSVREQQVRGLPTERVLLGCAQPGESVGRYRDALHHLAGRLHYLYSGNERYWYDQRPNLRREMEGRKQRYDAHAVQLEIRNRIRKKVHKGIFEHVHPGLPSGDVKDDTDLRLYALNLDAPHKRKAENSGAIAAANEILARRGDDGRSHKNRLLFLAPDQTSVATLKDQTRSYLAWQSIVDQEDELNLDRHHRNQARQSRDEANGRLARALRETYRWLLVPAQELAERERDVFWEETALPPEGNFASVIQKIACDHEWIVVKWAPLHLASWLRRLYWTDETPHVSAARVWGDMCKYLYLPRLSRKVVFEATIEDGVRYEDHFGFADAWDPEDGYKGLLFGREGTAHITDEALLVRPDAAKADLARKRPADAQALDRQATRAGRDAQVAKESAPTGKRAAARRFYGSVALDPLMAVSEFQQIHDNVIAHLVQCEGAEVTVRVDVEARHPKGFGVDAQRTVGENARTLGFEASDFESE